MPQLPKLELLILSVENVVELAAMHGMTDAVPAPDVRAFPFGFAQLT